jgi:ABC-type bacteriocin/lantibiotic exporter with double-glycine peptidase domain
VFLNFALEHLDVFSSMMDVFLLLLVGLFMMGLSLAFGFYRQQMGLKCFGFFSKHFSQSLFTRLLMLPLRLMNTIHSNELFSRVNNVEQMFYRLLQQFFYFV